MDLSLVHTGPWTSWWKLERATDAVFRYVKYSIPGTYRVHEEGIWYVHEKYIEGVKQLFPTDVPLPEVEDPYAVLHLRPTAPPAIIKAAWRELAKILHPDHGGSPEAFRRAKEAYAKLTKG